MLGTKGLARPNVIVLLLLASRTQEVGQTKEGIFCILFAINLAQDSLDDLKNTHILFSVFLFLFTFVVGT